MRLEDILGANKIIGMQRARTKGLAFSYPNLVDAVNILKKELNPKCDIVLYPASSDDISPSEAFQSSRVIYVDISQDVVDKLNKNGYEAYLSSAQEFVPDKKVDVLLLLGAGTFEYKPCEHVALGGNVLCNDYYSEATEMSRNNNFKLVGILKRIGRDYVFDKENPYDCWKVDEHEIKERFPDFYREATSIVQNLRGNTTNVMQAYLELYDSAVDLEEDGTRMLTHENKRDVIFLNPLPLPRKKSHDREGDFFVFQRIK